MIMDLHSYSFLTGSNLLIITEMTARQFREHRKILKNDENCNGEEIQHTFSAAHPDLVEDRMRPLGQNVFDTLALGADLGSV